MLAERIEFLERPWWVLTARYPDGDKARTVFERLARLNTGYELGVYRHGPPSEPGCFITIVSHKRNGMSVAERVMFQLGAKRTMLAAEEPGMVEAFIARRIRVMAASEESDPGEPHKRIIRRGTRGAILHVDGTLDERIGGG